MKTINIENLELVNGGSEMGDFVGGIACGASIGFTIATAGAGWWIVGLGCASLFM